MKRINISIFTFIVIIAVVSVLSGFVVYSGGKIKINELHADLNKALDNVNSGSNALAKCQVMRNHYETLYNLNK